MASSSRLSSGRVRLVAATLIILALLAGALAAFVAAVGLDAPVVEAYGPAGAKEVAANSALSIAFDRPMLAPLAEGALSIEPAVEGTYSWKGNILTFTPRTGWARGTRYTVRLEPAARSLLLVPLREPLTFEFLTAKELAVLNVQPADGTSDVAANNAIVVQFNYPVVPLGTGAQGPAPFKMEPSLPGKGRWVTTSLYMFQPEAGLPSGVRFNMTVPAGLPDTGGGKLAAEHTWSFTTKAPSVAKVTPEANTRFAGTRTEVRVTFDTPVVRATAEQRFVLKGPEGEPIVGGITWEGDALVFKPNQPLRSGTAYAASVRAGVKAERGGGETKDFNWSFTTVGIPRVLATTPAEGRQLKVYDSLRITFSGPMDRDSVEENLTITPKPARQTHIGWQDSDTNASIWAGWSPSTRYTVTIGTDAVDRFGQKLSSPVRLNFTTEPMPPSLRAAMPWFVGTFNAAGPQTVYFEHTNISSIVLALYRLDQQTFTRLTWDGAYRRNYRPPEGELERRWTVAPSKGDANQAGLTSTNLAAGSGSRLQPGYYYLRVTSPEGVGEDRPIMVSRTSLTMKRSRDQVLVWAMDISGGVPVAGVPIHLVDQNWATLASGRTDKDGLFQTAIKRPAAPGKGVPQLFALAEAEGNPSAVGSEWSEGIRPYEFGIPMDYSESPLRGYLYTDRPVYRPGQKVLFKGIVRNDEDARYSLPPAGTELELDINDSQGRKVQSSRVKLSDFGSFDGQLALSSEAPLGSYYISARVGEWGFGVNFNVAEYRKPEFEAKIVANQPSFLETEQVSVTGLAAYYFGQPLANAGVKWRLVTRDYFFPGESGYSFGDPDLSRDGRAEGARQRTEGETTSDAQGNFAIEFTADLTKNPTGQVFTIESTVMDPNNQEVSARTEVVVHKGEYYGGLRPESYVTAAGSPAAVEVLVVDRDKQPVPNARVAVSFYNRKWLSVKERQPDGGYVWSSRPEDTLFSAQNVAADASGKARATAVPKEAGSVRVVAEVSDSKGRKNRAATYLYVSGSGFAAWRMQSNDRLQLVTDKTEYAVGETARVLVPSPVADALALVTVERGALLTSRLVRLKGNSETLEVSIEAGFVPNAYVSVVLFKGSGPTSPAASFHAGYGELKVSSAEKVLKLDLTPDKARYQPGDKATYSIRTVDATGRGVPAEVSLAVVDASVLALADPEGRDAMEVFWGRRGLGVSTSATLATSVDRYNVDISAQRKGAGGGADGVTVRREFPDTAYWNPAIRTNDRGEASVAITVPDSLTTWRAMAQGVTVSTQVGKAQADTVVTKSLLLRPALPRFLLMGDQLTVTAFLHNYTDREVQADVTLEAQGVRPPAGGAFDTKRLRIAAGGVQKLEWPATVEPAAGGGAKASFKLEAKPLAAGLPGDAIVVSLPVHAPLAAEVVATSGEVRDSTTELVRLMEGASRELGDLTIELSPSLAAGMRFSARYLDEFPYECTEQTVSRFLPRVVMRRAFDKLGLRDLDGIAAKLPGIVARSVQRLYGGQRPDGGWGWWPGDASDQWVTAYAVHGLTEAARAGQVVDARVLDRATQFLRRSLDRSYDAEHPENPNSRAYVLYVLAAAGRGDLGLTNSLFDRRSTLGNYGRAYLALALHALNAGQQDGKLKSLIADLASSAIQSATGSHWEESRADPRTMNTNTRSTAIVLDALARVEPESPLVPSTARWLMVARKEGRWATTQETAMSLLGLTSYLQASGELQGDFGYGVALNGRALATEVVNRQNLDEAKRLVVPAKELQAGVDNRVVMSRAKPAGGQTGEGKLYYTLHLHSFGSGEAIQAESQGIALVREYFRLGDEKAGPLGQVKAGETVKVKLTMVALQDLHYLVVEDPLPSGLEAVDTRLKTTSMAAAEETGITSKEEAMKREAEGRLDPPWWKYDYFGRVEPRDDKVALFASYLPRGTYEYTYLARATTSGDFQAMPALGYEMYAPEVYGRSEGAKLRVE